MCIDIALIVTSWRSAEFRAVVIPAFWIYFNSRVWLLGVLPGDLSDGNIVVDECPHAVDCGKRPTSSMIKRGDQKDAFGS